LIFDRTRNEFFVDDTFDSNCLGKQKKKKKEKENKKNNLFVEVSVSQMFC